MSIYYNRLTFLAHLWQFIHRIYNSGAKYHPTGSNKSRNNEARGNVIEV